MADDTSPEVETADGFRTFEKAFKSASAQMKSDAKRAAAALRQEQIGALRKYQMGDAEWEALLGAARTAARHGKKEFLLLRFPSGLCSDGSRAINNPPDDTWPETLRGEPAEIYRRWLETLKPHGFSISAYVLDFPDGEPGDVGLFLYWGEDMGPIKAASPPR